MKTPMEFANLYIKGEISLPVFYGIHAPYAELKEIIKKLENQERFNLIFSSGKKHEITPKEFPPEVKEVMEKKRQAKLDADLITNTGTDFTLKDIKDSVDKEKKENIEAIQKICKVKTLDKLNLDDARKEKIYTALWEFTQAILLPSENLKKLNTKVVMERKESIKHIEKALKYRFLDESFKAMAQKEIKRLKEYDNNKSPEHPIMGLDFITTPLNFYIWETKKAHKKLIDMLQTPIKLKEGRPSNFFFEVLKIVVFKELDDAGIKTRTEHLAAEIINEFKKEHGSFIVRELVDKYIQNQVPEFAKQIAKDIKQRLSNLPHLTSKDIFNALPKPKKP